METLGIWISAFLTLAIYSFLWKDNPVFAFAEHTFVAVSAAHFFVQGYFNIVDMAVKPLVNKGDTLWLIPLIFGLLLYARFFKGIAWLSRFPVAVLLTIASAAQLRGALQAEFIKQIQATAELTLTELDNLIFVIGTLTVFAYFVHMTKFGDNQVMKLSSKIGRYFMMVAFGASLGTTVMARFSLLIGRLQFLFGKWIPIIK